MSKKNIEKPFIVPITCSDCGGVNLMVIGFSNETTLVLRCMNCGTLRTLITHDQHIPVTWDVKEVC